MALRCEEYKGKSYAVFANKGFELNNYKKSLEALGGLYNEKLLVEGVRQQGMIFFKNNLTLTKIETYIKSAEKDKPESPQLEELRKLVAGLYTRVESIEATISFLDEDEKNILGLNNCDGDVLMKSVEKLTMRIQKIESFVYNKCEEEEEEEEVIERFSSSSEPE